MTVEHTHDSPRPRHRRRARHRRRNPVRPHQGQEHRLSSPNTSPALGIDLKEVRVVPRRGGRDRRGAERAARALHLCLHHRRHRPDPRRHHRRLRRQGVRRDRSTSIRARSRCLSERCAETGSELNEARLRMARIPAGADLVVNKVSAAPGFWLGNVIVMAGVPSIMQAMLDECRAEAARPACACCRRPSRADAREGDIGTPLGEIAKAHPDVVDRQLSVLRRAGAEHQHRGARARCAAASTPPDGGRGDAARRSKSARDQRDQEATGRGTHGARPQIETQPSGRASIFRCRGTNFTATRARWRGGSPARARSRRSSRVTRGGLVPAAIVARELDIRLIETVCVASYRPPDAGRSEGAEVRRGRYRRARRRRAARAC